MRTRARTNPDFLMPPRGRDHRAALEAAGCPESSLDALARYLDLLATWEQRVNLTGVVRSSEERVDLLVRDPLAAAPEVENGPLLDIGSGNGSPGLVLAILRPSLRTTLLEPRQKRWAFLREAVRTAGRPEIEVMKLRHDAYRPSPLAQTVTLRALALPLDEVEPLIETGGRLLVFGGRPVASAGLVKERQPPLYRSTLSVFRRR